MSGISQPISGNYSGQVTDPGSHDFTENTNENLSHHGLPEQSSKPEFSMPSQLNLSKSTKVTSDIYDSSSLKSYEASEKAQQLEAKKRRIVTAGVIQTLIVAPLFSYFIWSKHITSTEPMIFCHKYHC